MRKEVGCRLAALAIKGRYAPDTGYRVQVRCVHDKRSLHSRCWMLDTG
ncbi:MAG: hypothetical protein M0Q38_16280 [Bacteroidales bacterium]|nr:hypothetical protein [Bacteroidales bacterium]